MTYSLKGDEATCIWILHEGSVNHLHRGKPDGKTVWAPGLLGTVALRGLKAARANWGYPNHGPTAEEGGRHQQVHQLGEVDEVEVARGARIGPSFTGNAQTGKMWVL